MMTEGGTAAAAFVGWARELETVHREQPRVEAFLRLELCLMEVLRVHPSGETTTKISLALQQQKVSADDQRR